MIELAYLDIALKLLMGLLSLIFVINLSGKGNLAPSSAMDQVLNYVLTFKWIKTNNHFFKTIIDGQPTVIIKRGILDVEACRSVGLTANDVAFKLRNNNVYSIKKIKQAILEQNGQLIIVLYGEENPKYPIITDGTVQQNILDIIDKDMEWLETKLKEIGYDNISQIFLAEYEAGEISVVTY